MARHSARTLPVVLAPLEPDDVPEAKALIVRVWDEFFADHADPFVRDFFRTPGALDDLNDLDRNYRAGGGTFLVARVGDVLVGTGGVKRLSPTLAEMTHLFVAATFRRRGIGRSIATALCDFAARHGCRTIRLGSNHRLTESHALYNSLGFQDIPPYEPGGERYARYLAKELSPPSETRPDPPAVCRWSAGGL